LGNGWGYVGELEKFVPVSAARVRGISTTEHAIKVMLTGTPGEVVQLSFVNTNSKPNHTTNTGTDANRTGAGPTLVTVECTFGEVGVLKATPAGCTDGI
jgi:hypothetical protein